MLSKMEVLESQGVFVGSQVRFIIKDQMSKREGSSKIEMNACYATNGQTQQRNKQCSWSRTCMTICLNLQELCW